MVNAAASSPMTAWMRTQTGIRMKMRALARRRSVNGCSVLTTSSRSGRAGRSRSAVGWCSNAQRCHSASSGGSLPSGVGPSCARWWATQISFSIRRIHNVSGPMSNRVVVRGSGSSWSPHGAAESVGPVTWTAHARGREAHAGRNGARRACLGSRNLQASPHRTGCGGNGRRCVGQVRPRPSPSVRSSR